MKKLYGVIVVFAVVGQEVEEGDDLGKRVQTSYDLSDIRV